MRFSDREDDKGELSEERRDEEEKEEATEEGKEDVNDSTRGIAERSGITGEERESSGDEGSVAVRGLRIARNSKPGCKEEKEDEDVWLGNSIAS